MLFFFASCHHVCLRYAAFYDIRTRLAHQRHAEFTLIDFVGDTYAGGAPMPPARMLIL